MLDLDFVYLSVGAAANENLIEVGRMDGGLSRDDRTEVLRETLAPG